MQLNMLIKLKQNIYSRLKKHNTNERFNRKQLILLWKEIVKCQIIIFKKYKLSF